MKQEAVDLSPQALEDVREALAAAYDRREESAVRALSRRIDDIQCLWWRRAETSEK